MNPIAIATIRDQIKRLETQAEQLSQEHPRTADQLRESAQQAEAVGCRFQMVCTEVQVTEF
jgi:hypothetical protein